MQRGPPGAAGSRDSADYDYDLTAGAEAGQPAWMVGYLHIRIALITRFSPSRAAALRRASDPAERPAMAEPGPMTNFGRRPEAGIDLEVTCDSNAAAADVAKMGKRPFNSSSPPTQRLISVADGAGPLQRRDSSHHGFTEASRCRR